RRRGVRHAGGPARGLAGAGEGGFRSTGRAESWPHGGGDVRTAFTAEQLADPETAASQSAIRKCVHCGFCTATCPTYVLLGDERDSPRGRIELIREMLEKGGAPPASTVTHIDRCLSCLACTTTCPSGVDYAQLIDHARAHIETHYDRPWREQLLRDLLAAALTHPAR